MSIPNTTEQNWSQGENSAMEFCHLPSHDSVVPTSLLHMGKYHTSLPGCWWTCMICTYLIWEQVYSLPNPYLEVRRMSNSSITQLSALVVPAWDFQHPNSLQTSKSLLRRNQFKEKSKNLAETQNLHCSVNLIYTACSSRTNLVPRGKL